MALEVEYYFKCFYFHYKFSIRTSLENIIIERDKVNYNEIVVSFWNNRYHCVQGRKYLKLNIRGVGKNVLKCSVHKLTTKLIFQFTLPFSKQSEK